MLSSGGRKGYLRRLQVAGTLYDLPPEGDEEEEYGEHYDHNDLESGFGDMEWLLRPRQSEARTTRVPDRQQWEGFWTRLAHLISQLGNLTDLFFACKRDMPPILLSTLHQHHSACRLHTDFYISSPTPSDELVLTESTCLYNVHCYEYNYDHIDHPDRRAVKYMMVERLPKLEHMCANLIGVPKRPLRSFSVSSQGKKGNLKSLTVKKDINAELLGEWDRHTRLEVLESLRLPYVMNRPLLDLATNLARDGKFRSLRRLELGHGFYTTILSCPDMGKALGLFLEAIPPQLEHVDFMGVVDDHSISSLLRYHGSTLRKLRLDSYRSRLMDDLDEPFTISPYVENIVELCPNLQVLEILTLRTEGDQEEVATYRTLGKLPKLQRLSLILDCSQRRVCWTDQVSPTEDMGGLEVSLPNIRKMLVNSALDEHLAVSIFKAISSSSLQWLKLSIVGAGNFGSGIQPEDEKLLFGWISRSWICEKVAGDGSEEDKIEVKEVGKRARIEVGKILDKKGLHPDSARIWDRIWPRRLEDWKEDWSSFPLYSEN